MSTEPDRMTEEELEVLEWAFREDPSIGESQVPGVRGVLTHPRVKPDVIAYAKERAKVFAMRRAAGLRPDGSDPKAEEEEREFYAFLDRMRAWAIENRKEIIGKTKVIEEYAKASGKPLINMISADAPSADLEGYPELLQPNWNRLIKPKE